LWQRKGRKIRDKEIQVWDRMAIVVPFVPPSGMPFCSLIDISYVIKVYFTFSTQIKIFLGKF
jgi:hypothetical protein